MSGSMTSATSHVVRGIDSDQLPQLQRIDELAFGFEAPPEVVELETKLHEIDRVLLAYDGSSPIGSTSAYSLDMTVPGGHSLPVAGVTWVGVVPTHRRRGVLSSLMRRQLDDIREAGRESFAALTASEPPIYGRFGYGPATRTLSLQIPRSPRALLERPSGDGLRLRVVEPGEAEAQMREVYERARPRRPGMLRREGGWEERAVFDLPGERKGASPLHCVLAEEAGTGEPRGYALYAMVPAWEGTGPRGEARVRDVFADDAAAYALLWRFLTDLDLVATTTVRLRPPDDPLVELLSDVRAASIVVKDAIFVRLVDAARALAERAYTTDVDVVLELDDAFCPWNTGRLRLSGGPGGATCTRTTDAPDIALAARELGAVYLGGVSLHALHEAGLVEERTPGAVSAASRALRHDPQPWCPIIF